MKLFFFQVYLLCSFASVYIKANIIPMTSEPDSLLGLIQMRKNILQQQIIRKNKYLSENFGVKMSIPASLQNEYAKNINNFQNFEYSNNYNQDFYQNLHRQPSNLLKQPYNDFYDSSNENYLKKPLISDYDSFQRKKIMPDKEINSHDGTFRFKESLMKNNMNLKRNFSDENQAKKNQSVEFLVKQIKNEVEHKILNEIISNFSKFSENISNLVFLLKNISNETVKNTEEIFKKTILINNKINDTQPAEKEKFSEKNDVYNISYLQNQISNQIERQFQHYFSLMPKLDLLKSNEDHSHETTKEEEKKQERNIGFTFKQIDKSKKWDIFEDKPIDEYFSFICP